MKSSTIKVILTILALLFGCNDNVQQRKNEISRIVFATGLCYGTCPVQAIEIDSSLLVKYHGILYTDSTGFFVGKVRTDFWDSLNLRFEKMNYKHLDSNYRRCEDEQSTEIYIYHNNNVKHIYGDRFGLPDSVQAVYNWLLKSVKDINLVRSNDTFLFPTNIQIHPYIQEPIIHPQLH